MHLLPLPLSYLWTQFSTASSRGSTPLQQALLTAGMADPGFLAAYPRTDLAALQGVGTTSAHIPGESSGDT